MVSLARCGMATKGRQPVHLRLWQQVGRAPDMTGTSKTCKQHCRTSTFLAPQIRPADLLSVLDSRHEEHITRFRLKSITEIMPPLFVSNTFTGPLSKLKPTQKCVALADGSGCVIRRTIAGDNSCLFNAVGYGMHKVRTRSAHLRSVVAATVSSDRQQYTEVVLEKSNDEVGRRNRLSVYLLLPDFRCKVSFSRACLVLGWRQRFHM